MIQSETARQIFTGNGVTIAFPVTLDGWSQDYSDLAVYIYDSTVGGDPVLQTMGTDYSFAGVLLLMDTAPTVTQKVIVMLNKAGTQDVDYVENDTFPAATHEANLDKVVVLTNQLKDMIGRAPLAPVNITGSALAGQPIEGGVLSWVSGKWAWLASATADLAANLLSSSASLGSALVAYLADFTGSVPRSLRDRLSDQVSVKDFGAVGDGVTDDTAAFQAALDAADGRVLYVGAGSFKITSTLNYKNNSGVAKARGLKIIGEGSGKTIFLNEVANGPVLDVNTGVGATAGAYFFSYGGVISGITIQGDGVSANSDGIRFRSCWDYSLRDVIIDSHTRYGIHIENDEGISPDCTASANMELSHVRITHNLKGIYAPYGNGWPLARLTHCVVDKNSAMGIEHNSSHFQMHQGSLSYNGLDYTGTYDPSTSYGGMVMVSADNYQAEGPVVSGVEMDDNTPQHLWVASAKGPAVRSCSIVSRFHGAGINVFDLVFGQDSASVSASDFVVEHNNFTLPTTLVGSGKTHTFVCAKARTVGGFVGVNAYSIAGGTAGTEIFFLREDVKATAGAQYRTKFVSQGGFDTRAAYPVQYDGAIPISGVALKDDTAISMTPLNTAGVIWVSFNRLAAYTALIGYDITGGKTFILTSGSTAIDIKSTSTVLTGTTGTDGKTTVSTDSTSGKIYIENRQGGSLTLRAQVIDGFGNWL